MKLSAYSVLICTCFILPLKATEENFSAELPTEAQYFLEFIKPEISGKFPRAGKEETYLELSAFIISEQFDEMDDIYSDINEKDDHGEEDSCILNKLFPLKGVESKEPEENFNYRKSFKEKFNEFENLYEFFPLKRKLWGVALKHFSSLSDFHHSLKKKLFPIIEIEILKKRYTINRIRNEMKDLSNSSLLNNILSNIPRYQEEILILFIEIFGDTTPLIQEIINHENKNKREENWTKEKVIKLRKEIIELKQHSKYKEMLSRQLKLTDDELIAIRYYCDPASSINRLGMSAVFKESKHWPSLYQNVRNGVSKIYKMYHYKNHEQPEFKFLYNGNVWESVKELLAQRIPLTFTINKQEAIQNGLHMLLMINNPKIGLMSAEMMGGNVSWIAPQILNTKRNDIYIILPASFRNFSRMNREEIAQHKLPNNPELKIYRSNEYRFTGIQPPHITPLQELTTKGLDDVRRDLLRILTNEYNEQFAKQVLAIFNKVIFEEQFEDVETIRDDVEDMEGSAILEAITKEIQPFLGCYNPKPDIMEMMKTVQDIVTGRWRPFAIKDFKFTVKQKDVTIATQLAEKESPIIYCHPERGQHANTQEGRAIVAEDKSLCIAKAVDLKNGYPILMWLLDTFNKDRMNGHKIRYQQWNTNNEEAYYPFEKDKYATGYTPTTWWLHDSAFCKYIQYKNSKMALPLMTAVQALSKRVLPQIHFNPLLLPCIHDTFNDFVKYTLGIWTFVHRLTTFQKNQPFIPVQFDLIIIPELVKSNPTHDNRKHFDLNEGGLNLEFLFGDRKPQQDGNGLVREIKGIWNLESHLEKNGYSKNENFWVEEAEQRLSKLHDQIYRMWCNANNGNMHPNRRYILIIDRRNPKNLEAKNMSASPLKCEKKKDWKDRIYLLSTEKAGKEPAISKKYPSIPEASWGYSKEFCLPNINKSAPIGMLDHLNSYMFGLSFHLYKKDSCRKYWYFNGGATTFELEDMAWLWPRYFHKANGMSQKISHGYAAIMKNYMDQKGLNDVQFEEFYRQVHAMKIVHEY